MPQTCPVRVLRFGVFEVNLAARELRKHGTRMRLPGQPFAILAMLLEKPGEVFTREEMRERLWASDTFVDFEHGLNSAIKKLRAALGDSPENPRYIETIPRLGYRFVPPVEEILVAPVVPAHATDERAATHPNAARNSARGTDARNWLIVLMALSGLALILVPLISWDLAGLRGRLLGKSGTPPIHSLAVLPLHNLSADPTQEYFSDGMTDALITELAQVGSLKVISRASIMRYKKTDKSSPEIARELNVDGIIEGTVQRSGDHVHITAQLIHGPSDKHLWARGYDRELRDALQLEGEVAHDIVEEISANLARSSGRSPVSQYSLNVDAYDNYLRGRNYVRRMTGDDILKGLEFIEHSIQLDPNYAPAYAELSRAYQMLAAIGHFPPGQVLPKAKAAAMKSLALDEKLAEAHDVLGLIYGEYEWDWAAEERELKRAIQLDPNSSLAHSNYAVHLLTLRHQTEGIQQINTALELDPFAPWQHSIASYVFLGARQYDPAIREARRAVEIDPSFALGHELLAGALGAKGMFGEALTEWLRYLSLDGDAQLARELEGATKKISSPGDPGHKLALITLSYYQRKSKTRYVEALIIAGAYIDLGDKDRTLEWLNKAYQERSTGLCTALLVPSWDPLRSDPRFQDLLRRMNLPVDSASASTRLN